MLEAYSESFQLSKMERFCKNNEWFLATFAEHPILDV